MNPLKVARKNVSLVKDRIYLHCKSYSFDIFCKYFEEVERK